MRTQFLLPAHAWLVAGALALSRAVGAQQPDPATLDAAVAAYARSKLPAGTRIGFDPAKPALRRDTADVGNAPAVGAETRAERAARALEGRVVHTPDVFSCGELPSSCRLKDVDAIVHWAPATVSGDSANVTLFFVRATGLDRVPIQQISYRVVLVRRGAGWHVERARVGRVT